MIPRPQVQSSVKQLNGLLELLAAIQVCQRKLVVSLGEIRSQADRLPQFTASLRQQVTRQVRIFSQERLRVVEVTPMSGLRASDGPLQVLPRLGETFLLEPERSERVMGVGQVLILGDCALGDAVDRKLQVANLK